MTAVLFKFQKPDGAPVVGAPFTVALRKPSFDEALDDGILLPGTVEGVTDTQGECTLVLAPGYGVYYLSMLVPSEQETPEGCMPGFHYKFSVPGSTEVLRIEDLIVTTPTWSRPWDEQALAIITEAKIASQEAAANSEASSQSSAASAQAAQGSAAAAAQQASNANTSAIAAAGSASAANTSKNAAAGSASTAATLAEQASVSAVNSGNSANAAATSATAAANSASTAASAGAAAGTTAGTAAANAVVANKQDKHVNLTGLAGVTAAADRLPYFTGAGPMGITSFTSKGRELVGQADEAAMRTFMGLVPVTTNNDVTASRLLNVGYGGLGGLPITLANANDVASKSGMECVLYGTEASSVTGNYPVLGGTSTAVRIWYSKVVLIASDSGYQIAVEGAGTGTTRGRRFKRILYGTWGPWVEDINLPQYGYAANDGADLPGGSWNGILLSGNYRFVPGNTNGPGTGINYGTVTRNAYQISSGTWTEFTQSAQEPRAWIRQSINNSSGNHYEIYTRYNALNDPQTDAATAGLLSATGISGFGVFKYANGQMCIIGPGTITPSCPANGTVLHTVTIPSGLINNATYTAITGRAIPQANQDHFGVVSATQPTATTIQLSIRNGPTGAQTFGTQICVWGQWK